MKKNVTLIVFIILLSYFSISWSNKYANDLNVEVLSDEDISQNNFLKKQKTKLIFETAANASSLPMSSPIAYDNIVNINLALNGTSTAINEAYGQSELAHDGNTDRDYNNGSLFVASSADEAWWNIDLGGIYIIDSIRIYSRYNYEDQLVNFYVLGNDTGFTGDLSNNLTEAEFSYFHGSSPIINPSLLVNVGGEELRYVRIRKTSHWSALALPEVEIYGRGDTIEQQLPFNETETPWPLPVTIQAEDYDKGGEGIAYHETTSGNSGGVTYRYDDVDIEQNGTGGKSVGWLDSNEWLEYTINSLQSGIYDFNFRLATPYSGKSVRVLLDSTEIGVITPVYVTNEWLEWRDNILSNKTVEQGDHILRVEFPTGDVNFDEVIITNSQQIPIITSSLTDTGTVNQAYSYQITATNSPNSYNATGLPTGLSIDTATGIISGTPAIAGICNIIIGATNVVGSDIDTLQLTIQDSVVNTNLAINGTSTAINEAYGQSELAHDGNTDRDYNNGSLFVASSADEAWWNIDLGGIYTIDSIRIYSRYNYEDQLVNFYVLGNETGFTGDLSNNLTEAEFSYFHGSSPIINPSLLVNVGGEELRYVRIRKTSHWSALALPEVEIYGRPIINDSIEAPTNLEATAVSDTQINLTWTDNSGNEDGFVIERSQTNSNYDSIGIVAENDTTYQDNGLSYKTTYFYRVKAFNTQTESNYSIEDSATTSDGPDPDPIIGIKRDLLHNQNAWIHENSVSDDIVTWISFNADSLRHSSEAYIASVDSYYIQSDPSGLFKVEGNWLKIDNTNGLSSSTIYPVYVGVAAKDANGVNIYDSALISVRCIEADSIKYVDLNANTNGNGTFTSPYNVPQTSMSSGIYYFYKRGTSYATLNNTIQFAEKSAMIAYGQGSKPALTVTNTDGDDYNLYISNGDDNCIVHGIEINCLDYSSRAIQITNASNIEISMCRIDSAGIGIRTDVDDYPNGADDCNNIRFYDNSVYYSGDDGYYISGAFIELVGNISKYASVTTDVGDAYQLTRIYSVYAAHNWGLLGDYYTEKQIFLLSNGFFDDDNNPYRWGDLGGSIVEHNTMYGGQYLRGGIGPIGHNATIRYNYVDLKGGWEYASCISAYNADSVDIYYNSVCNAPKAFQSSYYANKFYNNLAINCDKGIYASFSNVSFKARNNVFIDGTNRYHDLRNVSGKIDLDYNMYDTDGTTWLVNNITYTTFNNLQNANYEINGYYESPQIQSDNHPTVSGNMIDAGTSVGITKDFLGNPIVGAPDLGIIEYQGINTMESLSEKDAELTNVELEELKNIFLDSEASLAQNRPNPFNQETVINYYLPQNVTRATLNIYDISGAQQKSIELHQTGNGKITIGGGEFNAGMYMYSLIVDGQVIDTKRMVLTGTKVYF